MSLLAGGWWLANATFPTLLCLGEEAFGSSSVGQRVNEMLLGSHEQCYTVLWAEKATLCAGASRSVNVGTTVGEVRVIIRKAER